MDKTEPAFTFRAVQIFVATVDAQSVTRSAHRLGISPSSVSQQLTNLETALGTRLMVRSARSFRLTEAGLLFLDRAKALLDGVSAAKSELALAEQSPPMTLRIATIEEMDATATALLLRQLTASYPNIAFSLSSGASHENHDALASRAVDLMLAVDTVGEADWVEMHPILIDPFILIRGQHVPPINTIDTLQAHPFMRYSGDLKIGRHIEAQLKRTGARLPKRFEFSANRSLFETVAAFDGCAITTAFAYLATPLAHGMIKPQALPVPGFSRRLALHARAGALGDLPRTIASEMRTCLNTHVIPDALTHLPFLRDTFRTISNEEQPSSEDKATLSA